MPSKVFLGDLKRLFPILDKQIELIRNDPKSWKEFVWHTDAEGKAHTAKKLTAEAREAIALIEARRMRIAEKAMEEHGL